MSPAPRSSMHLMLLLLLLGSLTLALGVGTSQAAPFQSPPAENLIHEPLIVNNSGSAIGPSPQFPSERDGIPLNWILVLLFMLFIPAGALVASRRRH